MKKISIIVPVYNVEKYLNKCLNSLVNQTIDNYEIIVINDGSPDNSQKIIDDYAQNYPNIIKAFTKVNGGLSSARNYGLEKAVGEYVAFVDSDDYVDHEMFEEMYDKAFLENFDVVACNMNYIYKTKEVVVTSSFKSDLYNENDIRESLISIYPAICNKIYKKILFDDIKFKEGIWYEDVELTYRLFSKVKRLGVINKAYYQYLQRDNSITYTFNEKVFDYISNWESIIDYYKVNNLYDKYKLELEYSNIRYLYATMVKALAHIDDKQLFEDTVNKCIIYVKQNYPNFRKNKYFYTSLKGIYLLLFNKKIANLIYKSKH